MASFCEEFQHEWCTGVLRSSFNGQAICRRCAQMTWEWCYSRSLAWLTCHKGSSGMGIAATSSVYYFGSWMLGLFSPVFGNVYCCYLGFSLFIQKVNNAFLSL